MMKKVLSSPYFWGGLTGILAILSVIATTYILGKSTYLGASTTFVRASGFIGEAINPEKTNTLSYFISQKIKVDWQFMLIFGVLLGSLIASLATKTFKIEWVPPLWQHLKGGRVLKRSIYGFIGGVIAMIGARMADGCPSGHGLSGVMQLSLSSILALLIFFIVGIITARFFYHPRSGR